LLYQSEWLVSGVLVPFAGNTAVNEIFNISTYVQPGVVMSLGFSVLYQVSMNGSKQVTGSLYSQCI
jgi:hypothetical protein